MTTFSDKIEELLTQDPIIETSDLSPEQKKAVDEHMARCEAIARQMDKEKADGPLPVSSDQDDRRVTSTDALQNLSAPAPFALTDANITALEKAIRAEGFEILTDPETGEVKLTQQAKS